MGGAQARRTASAASLVTYPVSTSLPCPPSLPGAHRISHPPFSSILSPFLPPFPPTHPRSLPFFLPTLPSLLSSAHLSSRPGTAPSPAPISSSKVETLWVYLVKLKLLRLSPISSCSPGETWNAGQLSLTLVSQERKTGNRLCAHHSSG